LATYALSEEVDGIIAEAGKNVLGRSGVRVSFSGSGSSRTFSCNWTPSEVERLAEINIANLNQRYASDKAQAEALMGIFDDNWEENAWDGRTAEDGQGGSGDGGQSNSLDGIIVKEYQ